jgi:capsular polysaccharide biosynthesis protein
MLRNRTLRHRSEVAAGIIAIIGLVVLIKTATFAQDAVTKATKSTPTAWLRVGDAPETLGQPRNPAEYDQYRKTQAARIKSPLVLTAALRTPGIADLPVLKEQREPIEWLQDHLNVTSPLETEVLLVKMNDVEPIQATKIVNAVVEAFLEKMSEGERAQQLRKQELLQRTIKEKDAEIAAKRASMENLSKEFSQTGDAGFIRERYASSLKLATSVRERKLDNALEAAAAKLRVAAQANSNSPEATQAKLDLSIAEAKAEILQKTGEELRREMDDCVQELQGTSVGQSNKEIFRTEIAGAEGRRKELLKDLDAVNQIISLPPRIVVLERASPSE